MRDINTDYVNNYSTTYADKYNDNYSTTYADVYPSNNSVIPDGGNGAACTTDPRSQARPGSHEEDCLTHHDENSNNQIIE